MATAICRWLTRPRNPRGIDPLSDLYRGRSVGRPVVRWTGDARYAVRIDSEGPAAPRRAGIYIREGCIPIARSGGTRDICSAGIAGMLLAWFMAGANEPSAVFAARFRPFRPAVLRGGNIVRHSFAYFNAAGPDIWELTICEWGFL